MTLAPPRTAFRTCPLCEATCGLELTIEGDRITHVRGDREHVFSRGYICPKGAAFGELVHDPDRLRRPLVREGSAWREVTWAEAFETVAAGVAGVVGRHGSAALAAYVGNPTVHMIAGGLYLAPLLRALRTPNIFTAASVDQMPKHVSCGYLFGHPLAIPVPDVDRTDFMLILGANPWESNGSLATAPDFRGRLKALQARGGRFVVVDPRRTRTAVAADEHIPIRPGTDAMLLFGIVNTLFAEGLVHLRALEGQVDGVDEVRRLALEFPPERVAEACAIPAARVRALARELAAAPTAVVYGRVGTSTVEFGTLASWLVDVVNILTGNLDAPGGAMFPLAPHRRRGSGRGGGFTTGRWRSRVRGFPEVFNQLPVAVLAEEIDTPGEGQVRALLTIAGNPVLSTPNGGRLDRALGELEFMVSVDPYLNETTRRANVILPPTDPARVGHYDFAFLELAVRNTAAYSPPVLPPDPGGLDDATILGRLTLIAMGAGPAADLETAHTAMLVHALETLPPEQSAGRPVADLRALVQGDTPAEMLLDVRLRGGAYGDGFGTSPGGLSLATLKARPHAVDLGPLQPRLPEILRTASGRIELCRAELAADVGRLADRVSAAPQGLVLVGRRHLRSNNSWMHNLPSLMTGRDRCTLQLHPGDAAPLDLADGDAATIISRAGHIVATVELTDEVMRGVVSMPHGWGHDAPGTRMAVAARHPGVNSNIVADEMVIDPLSGNAVLNGIPVTVRRLAPRAADVAVVP